MLQSKKTDNSFLASKLHLRRYFLDKYHADQPPSVLDCCQGDGEIWSRLREEYKLKSYLGVDLKEKKGRLKIDSVRVLQCPGWTFDVIDVDTWGQPWKHYQEIARQLREEVTVFLTWGIVTNMMNTSELIKNRIGIETLPVPRRLLAKTVTRHISLAYNLQYPGLSILEAQEAFPRPDDSHSTVRYVGLRLAKKS